MKVNEVSAKAEKMKNEEMPDPDALLMFSCFGKLGNFKEK